MLLNGRSRKFKSIRMWNAFGPVQQMKLIHNCLWKTICWWTESNWAQKEGLSKVEDVETRRWSHVLFPSLATMWLQKWQYFWKQTAWILFVESCSFQNCTGSLNGRRNGCCSIHKSAREVFRSFSHKLPAFCASFLPSGQSFLPVGNQAAPYANKTSSSLTTNIFSPHNIPHG